MKATVKQIEKFDNTVAHAAKHKKCVFALGNVTRMAEKMKSKNVDVQAIFDTHGYEFS